jgi:hypothetical protein
MMARTVMALARRAVQRDFGDQRSSRCIARIRACRSIAGGPVWRLAQLALVRHRTGRHRVAVPDAQPRGPTLVLDITDRVECRGEAGLLGLRSIQLSARRAMSYTRVGPNPQIPLSRTSRVPDERRRTTLDPASSVRAHAATTVLELQWRQHRLRTDGYLYIGGGSGSGGDPQNTRRTWDLLGSILRIDVNVARQVRRAHESFATHANCTGGCPEIYAWSMRNPGAGLRRRPASCGPATSAEQLGRDRHIENGKNYGWRC